LQYNGKCFAEFGCLTILFYYKNAGCGKYAGRWLELDGRLKINSPAGTLLYQKQKLKMN